MLSPSWILPGLAVGLTILVSGSLASYLLVPASVILLRELSSRSQRIAPFTPSSGISFLIGVLAPMAVTVLQSLVPQA